jgi:rubrerythrin
VKIIMNKTDENLRNAFAGESQANRRYLFYAKKADEEGYSQIAKLFRAAAEAETVHAFNHIRVMGETESTTDNLNAAIKGENFEYKQMYPEYLSVSEKDKNQQATWSFNVANKVEEIHANLFAKVATALKMGEEPAKTDYFVCAVCGNTVEKESPETCSICGAPMAKFFKVI